MFVLLKLIWKIEILIMVCNSFVNKKFGKETMLQKDFMKNVFYYRIFSKMTEGTLWAWDIKDIIRSKHLCYSVHCCVIPSDILVWQRNIAIISNIFLEITFFSARVGKTDPDILMHQLASFKRALWSVLGILYVANWRRWRDPALESCVCVVVAERYVSEEDDEETGWNISHFGFFFFYFDILSLRNSEIKIFLNMECRGKPYWLFLNISIRMWWPPQN